MVDVEQLKSYYYAEPFRPLEIILNDGRRIAVHRRENFGWFEETRTLVFPGGPDAVDWTDFSNVAELRPLTNRGNSGRRRKAS